MLRMRQIALIASDLQLIQNQFESLFKLSVCHRHPGVAKFGLENFLMPISNSFLEVVAPFTDDSAGARYLTARNGDSGYMVIMQTDDIVGARTRVTELGIRLILDGKGSSESTDGIQLHPKDLPGAIAELRWNEGDSVLDGPWSPAGDNWQPFRNTDIIESIIGAEISAYVPEILASQWSAVLDIPTARTEQHGLHIQLDDAILRFVQVRDDRGEGLSQLDFMINDVHHVRARGDALGLLQNPNLLEVCGIEINLIESS